MSKQADVVIIGGGIIGVTAAYYLAQEGVRVTLVEKGDIAAGSSYGNAGLVCPCHSEPIPMPGVLTQGIKWLLDPESPFYIKPRLSLDLAAWLWRFQGYCNETAVNKAIPALRDMQRSSLALYRDLIAQENIECHFAQRGGLTLYKTQAAYDHGRREVDRLQQFGLQIAALDGAALRELEPNIHPAVVGGVQAFEDAHIDPALFVEGLAAAAERLGARLLTKTEVLGLETTAGSITAVRTTRGDLYPQQVVLAAGAWSTAVARQLGLNIPMQPAKGYSITLKQPANYLNMHLHLGEARVAVTPMGPHLRLAGTLELAGFDFSINQRRVNAIARAAGAYLLGLDNPEVVEIWRGMRPCPPDGLPYIGRPRSHRNLVVATGHAMLGVSMGPITGKLVSQVVCPHAAWGERPLLNLTPFTADRFN